MEQFVRSRSKLLPDVLGGEISALLERRIVYLELMPGAHLTEQGICDELGVSRSPVRESFRQLEAKGLVVRYARRGIRVSPMTEAHLNELYSCKIPLEALAAARAARLATKEDLLVLDQCLQRMSELRRGNIRLFFDENVQFLNQMHHSASNKTLLNILSIIETQALRYRYFAHISTKSMVELSLTGLSEIHEAIRSHRPAHAKRVTTRVMTEACTLIARVLRETTLSQEYLRKLIGSNTANPTH
jgi:DNA-binding GntR family transcriptional regulator